MQLLTACGLIALALTACGNSSKPEAGSASIKPVPVASRGRIDDPRATHLACLKAHHIDALGVGRTNIQIGPGNSGPLIVFTPTSGQAQGDQITGQAQAAEIIGAALLYPRAYTDTQLSPIEACIALGVKG
jgi:hypothetical protein